MATGGQSGAVEVPRIYEVGKSGESPDKMPKFGKANDDDEMLDAVMGYTTEMYAVAMYVVVMYMDVMYAV